MSTQPSWLATRLLRRNLLPEKVIRAGVRHVISARLRVAGAMNTAERRRDLLERRGTGPIAASDPPDDLPHGFYRHILGRQLKYSTAYWDASVGNLDGAEEHMLALTAERAGLRDGQRILDLGCGWGSMALWLARHFPNARVTAVSNVPAHKAWIDAEAQREGLRRLEVITADMNDFDTPRRFDRVVAIEMFEQMRNWRALLANISRWLEDDGQLFLQMLTRDEASASGIDDAPDVISAFFFGGLMPVDRFLYECQGDLEVCDHWRMSGQHGRRTAEAWLANMNEHQAHVLAALQDAFGKDEARRRFAQHRVFLVTCAELWDWRGGDEWLVSHYTMAKGALVRKGTT